MDPEHILTPEEFHHLIKTAENSRDRLILLLLGGAGLRVGEMTQIRVEDLNLEEGHLHIRANIARGGRGRTVALPRPVIAELKHYLANSAIDGGYVFPGKTLGHISVRRIQIVLNSLAERSNLQVMKYLDRAGRKRHRISPCLLRHSFAIWSLDSGVPILDLKEQLGHSTLLSTGVYVQAAHKNQRHSYLHYGFENKLLPRKESAGEEVI
jgi:integrase/recombinase XerD